MAKKIEKKVMKEKLQVNVDFTNFPELHSDLVEMAATDFDGDRSKFIRSLVRQEKSRRMQLVLPLVMPTEKIEPVAA